MIENSDGKLVEKFACKLESKARGREKSFPFKSFFLSREIFQPNVENFSHSERFRNTRWIHKLQQMQHNPSLKSLIWKTREKNCEKLRSKRLQTSAPTHGEPMDEWRKFQWAFPVALKNAFSDFSIKACDRQTDATTTEQQQQQQRHKQTVS